MTAIERLVGVRVRRVDAPEPSLLALTLYAPDLRTVLLLRFAAEPVGVGLVDQRPIGQPASAFVQKLRKELENARIAAFEQIGPATLALVLARGDAELPTRLACDFAQGTAWLERDGKTLIRSTPQKGRPPRRVQITWPADLEQLVRWGRAQTEERAEAGLGSRRAALERVLRTARKRLSRRILALQQDQARSLQAAPLRARANLVLSQQQRVHRGQTSVSLIDYTLDPPTQVEVPLDPRLSLQEQIASWFKQAKRFERGAQLAADRELATVAEIAQIDALLEALQTATEQALPELGGRARALGIAGVTQALATEAGAPPARAQPRGERKPYKQFAAWKDRVVLVGKSASDNDALTREHARPHDLWLHARGYAGAHVVVPLERNEACPDELLLDAAHLAAHFSEARGEPVVEISYTPKRYVRKPRGSAAGQAQLEREKVLALQLEPARVSRLLGRERHD